MSPCRPSSLPRLLSALVMTAVLVGCDCGGSPPAANVPVRNVGVLLGVRIGQTSEAGDQATFPVSLTASPTANVTVRFASSDATEGKVANPELTFTPDNWNAPQTLVVTGLDDDAADGLQAYEVTYTVSSEDAAYARLESSKVSLQNKDNDTAGITVSAVNGATTEAGAQATFTVVLDSEPEADVVVQLDSDNAAEGTVSPTRLTFTPANWRAPQTVTVTGVDDDAADGSQVYAILFGPTSSTDAAYAALSPGNVSVSNTDDETAGITVSAISGPTSEAGGQATFSVVLNSRPFEDVTVHLDSSDATEGVVDVTQLRFTPENWKAPQTVSVTGVDDDRADGNQPYAIVFGATVSGDTAYSALVPGDIALTNTDDDSAGITVSAISGPTTEAGGQATFTVALHSEPTSDVTVSFDSNDTTEGTVGTKRLTFTPADWKTPQTVTVTGVNDDVADGNQPYVIVFDAVSSADAAYAAIALVNVGNTNTDDDSAGITVSAVSGPTTETGGQASFTVVLTSEPISDVTVNFDSNDTTEGTVSPKGLTFTPANWKAPRTVTVTGVDDDVADGAQSYAIVFGATTSTDGAYAALRPGNVGLTNTDNDSAGFAVSAASGDTTELGAQATFTVALTSRPTADVTVSFDSGDTTEGTVGVKSLTFTPANWKTAQTVTVTGVADGVADGPVNYAIVFGATTSADAVYANLKPASVTLVNRDVVLQGSYALSDGPYYKTNPPTYTCLEACALRFGGAATDYQCSISSSAITRTAYLSGWGDRSSCTTPRAETYKLNSFYDCGSIGCAYSAYVLDNCLSGERNYCFKVN